MLRLDLDFMDPFEMTPSGKFKTEEVPTFGAFAGVNSAAGQWQSLALGQAPPDQGVSPARSAQVCMLRCY